MKTKIILPISVIIGLGLVAPVQATTRIWNGLGANSNWTTSANWGGTAPVEGDDLVFPATGVDLTSLNNTNTCTLPSAATSDWQWLRSVC